MERLCDAVVLIKGTIVHTEAFNAIVNRSPISPDIQACAGYP